jgi:lipid-A-disaccharide synthase
LVPELIQKEARGERMAEETMRILEDEPYRRGMIEGLAEVKQNLGSPGAAERVARMAMEMIKK